MKFEATPLAGAFSLELDRIEDDRGFFARTFCAEEFARRGLAATIAQTSIAFNEKKGTLRGLHWQAAPHEEAKIVRCVRGAVLDVLVDVRPGSPTFRKWAAFELGADDRRALYVPEGVAHGYQTLEDRTELHYMMSVPYAPGSARGARWDDPAFGVRWPDGPRTIAPRDLAWPDFPA